MNMIYVALLVYALIFIFLGRHFSQGSASATYHLSERKVGYLAIAASTFTLIGGGEFITLTAFSYWFGWWALLFFGGVMFAFIVLALLSKQARRDADEKNMHVLSDFFFVYFGKLASVASTIIASITLLSLFVIQLVVGGQLLEVLTGVPYLFSVTGMVLLILLYIIAGGINSVLGTDIIQAAIMIGLLITISIVYGDVERPKEIIVNASSFPGIGMALTLICTGFFAVIGGADVWQRILISKDSSNLRKGMLFNAGGWFFFGIVFILLAMTIQATYPNEKPEEAFFIFMSSEFTGALMGMLAIFLLSALLSTADTELFALSSMFNREFTRHRGKIPSAKLTRLFIVLISAVAFIIAISSPSLINTYFTLLYFMMILGPIVLAKLLGRGTASTALIGMIVGSGVLIWLIMTDKVLLDYYPLLVILAPACSFLFKYQENGVKR